MHVDAASDPALSVFWQDRGTVSKKRAQRQDCLHLLGSTTVSHRLALGSMALPILGATGHVRVLLQLQST